MSFEDEEDVDISPEAWEIIRQHAQEESTPEEAIEEIEDSGEELDEQDRGDLEEQDLEEEGSLSDEAEYYDTFDSYEEALAFARDYPGVFVITWNDETEQYDVFRDYGNEAAA